MAAEIRHERILEMLRRHGYVAIEELALGLSVTPQTVRRDLQDLAGRGALRRHHGGASLPSSIANTDYALRHVENAAEKARIAQAAAALVPEGSSVFLTLGTTVEATAAALAGRRDLRVVTNSTAAARILGVAPGISVQVLGGAWRPQNGGLAGALAAEMAARWRCDVLITGIGAICAEGWLLDYHEDEVAVARTMLANARRTVLVADHSKFHKVATCTLAPLSAVAVLVTDRALPAPHQDAARAAGTEVVVACTSPPHVAGGRPSRPERVSG